MNIYIDSDVIVASELKEEQHYDESKVFMEYVLKNKSPDIAFFTSLFTFLELASAMIRRTKNQDKAYSLLYRATNTWKDSIAPLNPIPEKTKASFKDIVDSLIETSLSFHTSSGDTIHAQTAASYEIDYLVTWNKKHFVQMEQIIENIKILTPTEILGELKDFQKTK